MPLPPPPSDAKASYYTTDEQSSDAEHDANNRSTRERRLVRKVDARMSILIVMFVLNYIDRNNIAVARLSGFEKDLHLKGAQYPTVLAIFFIGYIVMMVPSNMFLNHLKRPSLYLPACAVVWGIICLATGLTTNFASVLICRFFLGVVEGSFFPGALLTLAAWYKQEELGLRSCALFCGILISTAFGSLMATGILEGMEGKLGQPAWRWLFYIEGAITIVIAVLAMFVLPDFPDHPSTSKWLRPDEATLALLRKVEDTEGLADEPKLGQREGLVLAVSDWKVWWLGFATACFQVSVAFHQYIPTLAQTLGYNRMITLLLCSPPSFMAALYSFATSRLSDVRKSRFPFIAISMALGLIGCVVAASTMNTGARYFSLFLMDCTSGAYVVLLAWTSNSFSYPTPKRAVALGLVSAFGQLGAFAASYVFPSKWGPDYRNSFYISISANFLTIVTCFIHRQALHLLNRHNEAKTAAISGHSSFKYIL